MSGSFIVSEKQVHQAMEVIQVALRQMNAHVYAARKYEHMVKVVKAREMLKRSGTSAAREMEAMASEEYEQACEDSALADAALLTLQAKVKDAYMVIELWRTQRADVRSLPKL